MFSGSRSFRRLPSPASHKTTHWHKALAILALSLCAGGAGQTTSVQAAPRATLTIDSYQIWNSPLPNPACAHSRYDIDIFARIDTVAELSDNFVELEGGPGPSVISVTSESSNPDVAELNPDNASATWREKLIGKAANFRIKTDQTGSSTLSFTAKIESRGESVSFKPHKVPITVVHCNFKVLLTSILQGSLPETTESVVASVIGEIGETEAGELTGEGTVTWTAKQATPCFQAIQTITPSKAALYGSLSEDGQLLSVHVSYDQAMFFTTNTVLCGAGVSGAYQLQFQPPPLDFVVPITGDTLSKATSIPLGDAALNGTTIITVIPIKNE